MEAVYRRIIAVVASFMFVLLLLFPSLGIESSSNFNEGLEKEIVENSGKVAFRETQETIASGAIGFEVLLASASIHENCTPFLTVEISSHPKHIFLMCCSLLI